MPDSIDEELRRLLAEAGEAPDRAGVVRPGSAEAVAAAVAVCARRRAPFSVGSGPAPAGGGSGAVLHISLERLRRIAVEPANLVCRAEAGASVAELRQAVEREGLAVLGLPATTRGADVGSLVARGEVPRRALTGVEVVLATGEAAATAGRVLKDVATYDLPALMLGSRGRLGLLVAASFRLQPARAALPVPPPAATWAIDEASPVLAALDPVGLLRPSR